MNPQRKSRSTLIVLAALLAILAALITWGLRPVPVSDLDSVTLRPGLEGGRKVPVWHALDGTDMRHELLAAGTRCRKLDTQLYRLADGGPPSYFHRVDCDGVVGYVHRDQVR